MSFEGAGGDKIVMLTGRDLEETFDLIDANLADEE
jgi:hypothetical protein